MHCLQGFIFPNLDIQAVEPLYIRMTPGVTMLLNDRKIRFIEGSAASFDTFFNSLTVGPWKSKCKIEHLGFRICGRGAIALRFGLHRLGMSHRWLAEFTLKFDGEEEKFVDLPFWPTLEDGMVYASVSALAASEVSSAAFVTNDAPRRDVKLGIVITHFNRKRWVVPAIARIRDQLINDPAFRDRVELVVVDNSRSIDASEAQGATLIPNRNLGGSGGFTRGLLHLEDNGSFTHCLFMDDDASCEIESIRRTYRLLGHATEPRFAVAGALLRELESNRLIEKGALFEKMCLPLKAGLDMNNVYELLLAERAERQPDYGAWWFFAFALMDVKHYPFPFFVRGDDIVFGLMNRFAICTINGVATWSDDFALKSGPTPLYLDARSNVVIRMIIHRAKLSDIKKLTFKHFFFPQLFSYNYASAAAVALALEHVAQGPQFWRDNLDMAKVRAAIAAIPSEEKMRPLSRSDYAVVYPQPLRWSRLKKFIWKHSLNGFLLPDRFIKNSVIFQHKSFAGNPKEIYRRKRVLYEYEALGTGYIATHDKVRFFAERKRFLAIFKNLAANYDRLQADYFAALPELTGRKFWESIYRP